MGQRQYTTASSHTASTRDSQRSANSCESRSTAPTSLYESPRPSTKGSSKKGRQNVPETLPEDLSPSTSIYPRSSTETYSSRVSSMHLEEDEVDDRLDDADIPPLPEYRHEITDTNVRPSTPEDFAALFPSMNRLSIRHDDFTADGNMNLRVDTPVSGRRRRTIQLFHLRMHDLNKREFSLRRYCRDSGREVCNSKRHYAESSMQNRPNLQRSMSSVVKNLRTTQLKRTPTSGSMFSTKSRPGTGYSAETNDEFNEAFGEALAADKKQRNFQVPTNTIKLEFSNYARVDVVRCGSKGSKRYEFEWWGHKYAWKRATDKLTGVVSFHLIRDGASPGPVAHIVPETRSPCQVEEDDYAGGWVPPCHMWLSDESLINTMTDVADVVVATGLIALVDDCIKQRWGTKKTYNRIGLPLRSRTMDFASEAPRNFVQQIFSRRYSDNAQPNRQGQPPVAAY
ncbi:hypothetical protein BX600DRAFT_505124 [Xylariales sp. PMI_506]|nr:hypothetical protein BX600DRAFT_505124 [Xylariales sp. PMI_506]